MPEPRSRPSAAPPPALPARYESVRPLGRGGMSSVWCARDTVLGRRVAIKLLAEAFTGDERARQRFMREARAAARLSGHPNVVTIFDVGECEGRPYLVMEHLAGGTVADAIALGAYSQGEALRWIAQAAAALDHAHARGVVHRDVKPANMLLTTDRTLRLADFGLASLASEQTLSGRGELLGTAAYIAPEQALGRPATAASDRYALAVAAFELLTGQRPFDEPTMVANARAHIEREPPAASRRDPRLPAAVDDVLARGMAKRPQDRWPSACELACALADALAGTSKETPSGASANRERRRQLPSTVAAPAGLEFESDGFTAPASKMPPAALSGAWVGRRAAALLRRRQNAPRRRGALGALVVMAVAAAALGGLLAGSLGQGGAASRVRRRAARAQQTFATMDRPSGVRAGGDKASRPHHSAAWLEARGHELMLEGRYGEALPVLREAVSRAPHTTLTYAYALFDLGRTLALDGHPKAAIPILERRLQIPNQPQVVLAELAFARREAGIGVTAGAKPGTAGTTETAAAAPTVLGRGRPERTARTPGAPGAGAPGGGAGRRPLGGGGSATPRGGSATPRGGSATSPTGGATLPSASTPRRGGADRVRLVQTANPA